MSYTAECVDRWDQDSRVGLARIRAAAGSQSLGEGGVAVGHYALPLGRDYQAEREYGHYRGVPYSAIRPIAHTLAGQPVRVARVAKGGKSKSATGIRSVESVEGVQTAFRARLNDGREALVPRFVKEHGSDLELYESHPILDLLRDPNPIMTDWHMRCVTTASMELTGRAHWWYTKGQGRIVLWPLPTSWVTPIHDPGPFASWRIYSGGSMASKDVSAEEIIYFYYPDPSHLLGSTNPIQAQHRAVRADESIQEAQEALFDNSVFPRYGFYTGDITSDEEGLGLAELDALQRSVLKGLIMQEWAGASKSGEPIVFDKLIRDVKRLSSTVEEMDFLDSSNITYERITQAIGAHPYVMGKTEPSSRAASAESRRHFADYSINPRAELQSKTMTKGFNRLMVGGREQIIVWIEPYTPDDREERRADWESLAKYQSCNRNELRSGLLGLGPMVDGETIPAPPTAVLIPAEPAPRAAPIRLKSIPADTPEIKAWLKAHERAENRLAAVAIRYFESQRKDVQKRLRKLLRAHGGMLTAVPVDQVLREVFDAGEWDGKIWAAFESTIHTLMLEGAAREWAARSKQALPVGDLPANVQAAIQAELETIRDRPYWQDMNATTRRRLADTLEAGIRAGESEYELIVRIGDSPTVPGVVDGVLGSASNTVRSAAIARTECLAGDTPIDGAVLTAAYRRFYRGPMFKVITESGRELTGSPNHPMLTLRGWVSLSDLTKADYLIANRDNTKHFGSSGDQNIEARPTTIREIFDSLSAILISARERCREPDFHGDGVEGDVDILRAFGPLPIGRFAAIDKLSVNGILTPADAERVILATERAPFSRAVPIDGIHGLAKVMHLSAGPSHCSRYCAGANAVFSCDIGRLDTSFVVRDNLRERELFAITPVSGREHSPSGSRQRSCYANPSQCAVHGVRADAQFGSDSSIALARKVQGDCLCCHVSRQTEAALGRFGASSSDISACTDRYDPRLAASESLGNLSVTHTRHVELDRVRSILRLDNWSGHVYNLSTVCGYFNAAQLYTGNTTMAMNAGHWESQEELLREGLILAREWNATLDQYVRPAHLALHGVTAPSQTNPDGLFDVAGYRVPYPGHGSLPPEQKVNCRCVLISRF